MLCAAVVALIWANTPAGTAYRELQELTVGPAALHLDLSLATWAADGLLAVFFFVAGLELKRELVIGELRERRTALLPVLAALGGMVVPAGLAALIIFGEPGAGKAWAIPMATDIAFALAVLAIAGSPLSRSVRIFLLSVAVVDDLGVILIIALVFTSSLSLAALAVAVALAGGYALLQHLRVRTAWAYVPLALGTWVALHESGVHATIAGMTLALLTRVRADPGEEEAPAARLEHRLQPWSAGFCVPVFAFFAAGVVLSGDTLSGVVTNRVALGVMVGLLVGKALGVLGGALLAVRFGRARRPGDLRWREIGAVAVLGGVGFTVSLLVTELSFTDPATTEQVKAAVLVASLVAAGFGAVLLRTPAMRGRPTESAGPQMNGRGA
ncbi:MAG: Na+/H+ antiporter NhaA [Geodermatophilaceae bacterium]|nr:Na+/H+ antiporter NhaA [Geodermatophilaceae bacterium]